MCTYVTRVYWDKPWFLETRSRPIFCHNYSFLLRSILERPLEPLPSLDPIVWRQWRWCRRTWTLLSRPYEGRDWWWDNYDRRSSFPPAGPVSRPTESSRWSSPGRCESRHSSWSPLAMAWKTIIAFLFQPLMVARLPRLYETYWLTLYTVIMEAMPLALYNGGHFLLAVWWDEK